MQNASHSLAPWSPGALTAALTPILERHFGIRRLKRGMIAMLAGWLGYFIVISMTIRTLNRVTVPYLDEPLGVLLVIQGTAVIFIAALILLVRAAATADAR